MSGKIKIGSVVACSMVVVFCIIGYSVYVSEAIYDTRVHYPEVEGCSARVLEEMPEGYHIRRYEEGEESSWRDVVEVTWQLSNITNESAQVDYFWANYDSEDDHYLDVMEKNEEDLAIAGYENRRVLPPGERTNYTEYVLVPKGSHVILATPGYTATQPDGGQETFTLEF